MASLFSKAILAGIITAGPAVAANPVTGNTATAEMVLAQASPPSGTSQTASPVLAQGMMGPGMMGQGMTGYGTTRGGMGPMPGHMMKVMFAVADVNGDKALSFDEIMALHKRVFDAIDNDRDGKVTPAELQTFMQE